MGYLLAPSMWPWLPVSLAVVLTQTVPDISPYLNFGAAGAVLAWFLFRTEGRLDRIENALDRLVRAQMLAAMIGRAEKDPVRLEAEQIVREIDASSGRR